MSLLRRISTRRLILLCAAVLAVAGGGAAIALAAAGGGAKPPRQPLARAVHQALVAPDAQGVTARVEFKNRLLDGIDMRGANPLLSGATGRVWATNDGRFRLELQATGGSQDAQVVSDGTSWWAYDGSSDTVYRGTIPKRERVRAQRAHKRWRVPSVGRIQREINRVMRHADITGPTPTNIAGEPAYSVRMEPKRYGGLLGALEYAWDTAHSTPLRGAVYARGDDNPVLEMAVTDISFGPVDASTFDVPAPNAAHTQQVAPHDGAGPRGHGRHRQVTGLRRVQRRAGFSVTAPAALAGKKRQEVALLGGRDAVLVAYGRGLDGIAVIEKKIDPGTTEHDPLAGASLPEVTIDGVKAQELSTPLGTALRFERDGVRYLVVASAKADVVEAAARGLF